jgi:hypothetical protein
VVFLAWLATSGALGKMTGGGAYTVSKQEDQQFARKQGK